MRLTNLVLAAAAVVTVASLPITLVENISTEHVRRAENKPQDHATLLRRVEPGDLVGGLSISKGEAAIHEAISSPQLALYGALTLKPLRTVLPADKDLKIFTFDQGWQKRNKRKFKDYPNGDAASKGMLTEALKKKFVDQQTIDQALAKLKGARTGTKGDTPASQQPAQGHAVRTPYEETQDEFLYLTSRKDFNLNAGYRDRAAKLYHKLNALNSAGLGPSAAKIRGDTPKVLHAQEQKMKSLLIEGSSTLKDSGAGKRARTDAGASKSGEGSASSSDS